MPTALIRVGRWMSSQEYASLKHSGFVQESSSGTTHVALPADRAAFESQAAIGSFYVEFNVPVDSVKQTQSGWAKIIGPNTVEARLAGAKGRPIPQMPQANNIQHVATK